MLGDLVGYGAEPNAVIERVRALDPLVVIRGNHDKAACGIDDGSSFNYVAELAAQWTCEALSSSTASTCGPCRRGRSTIDDAIEICHGAPFDEDHYIFDSDDASRALDAATRPLCLFGHTHLPVVFRRHPALFDGFMPEGPDDATLEVIEGDQLLINVGSVGQPRDGDPRAAFGIYDSAAVVAAPTDRVSDSAGAAADSGRRDCRRVWRIAWRSGDSGIGIRELGILGAGGSGQGVAIRCSWGSRAPPG